MRLAPIALTLLALPAHAAPPDAILGAWTELNAASIELSSPGVSGTTRYDFEIAPGGDARIQVASTQNGASTKGTLMLVAGVLLAKDIELTRGSEFEAFDACGITLQLVNRLLAYGAAVPPMSIRARKEIDLVEKVDALEVKTSNAEATLPPPWSLRGSVDSAKTGVVTFDIVHQAAEEVTPVRFVGTWEKRPTPPSLPDTTPIEGWNVYRPGAAEGAATAFPTLGALRAAVQKP